MLERNIEKLLFACRWLLAPMYLGLSLALLALAVKFFQEAGHALAHIFTSAADRSGAHRTVADRHRAGRQPHRDGDAVGLRELRVENRRHLSPGAACLA